ncbi:MAG: DUF4143 domain-containing protein [Actinobacteria bacterium]|nr:DUF4143 domain-containing protein [Actinomycetota bacterium]
MTGRQVNETHLADQLSLSRPTVGARDTGGRHEVDAVIEWPGGEVVGVEVKRARSVKTADAAGLRWLAHRCRGRMIAGVVLYGGAQLLPLGPDILAMPVSSLWSA